MELLLYGRYIIMIFSPLSSQFRINFCKNLQKIYCINSVLYSKCLPCTKNAISRLTSGPQKSFTTLFSPDRHRKKAQYSFYHKNLEKGNKITNNEGYRFFGTPCRIHIEQVAWTRGFFACRQSMFQLPGLRQRQPLQSNICCKAGGHTSPLLAAVQCQHN